MRLKIKYPLENVKFMCRHTKQWSSITTILLFFKTEEDDKVSQDKQIKKYIVQHKGLIII